MRTLVRTVSVVASAAAIAVGGQLAVPDQAGATPASCSTWGQGATGYFKCAGTPSNGWTQYRITITCYDYITSSFVGGGTSGWKYYGQTASKTCGAPQRQEIQGVSPEFR